MLHRMVSRSVGAFAVAALGLGLAACEDNTSGTTPTPPAAVPAYTVEIVSYDAAGGPVNAVLPNPVIVKLLNPDGSVAAAGTRVNFTATGGGLVANASANTDAAGLASSGAWKLGKVAGNQRLTISASNVNSYVDVPAAPLAFHSLSLPAGFEDKSFVAGDTISTGPVFVAVDTFNNRIPAGTSVTFSALEGSISPNPSTVVTDDLGNVSPGEWTLSTLVGPQRLQASYVVNGLPAVSTLTVQAGCTSTQLAPSSDAQGQWRSSNCRYVAGRIAQYTLTTPPVGNLPNISAFGLSLQGVAGQALQLLSNGVPVQLAPPAYIYSATANPYQVNYIVPPGNYDARAVSPSLADNFFTLTRSGNLDANLDLLGEALTYPAASPVGCGEVGNVPWFTAQGLISYGYLDPSNTCNAGGFGVAQDRYEIQLAQGDTLNPTLVNWSGTLGLPSANTFSLRIRDASTAGGAVLATGAVSGAGTSNYANPDLGTPTNANIVFIGNVAGVNGFVAPTAGVYEIIVGSTAANKYYQLFLAPPIKITSTTLPNAVVGTAYSAGLAAVGGAGTLNWSVAAGALPAKFALAATGAISGSPETAAIGTYTFKASVFAGSIAQQQFTLTVVAAP